MSWVEKERKRRQKLAERQAAAQARQDSRPLTSGEDEVRALWQRIEEGNAALPPELQLRRETMTPAPERGQSFQVWLHAHNGAGLGFTGDALRYTWPERKARTSNNFWIRWNRERAELEVSQRVSSATPPLMKDSRFDERRTDLILRGLVRCERVKASKLRKKRFWLF